MSARRRVELHDVVLRLLDHQLIGPDGTLLGNVDDLELVARGDEWRVTGIMVGPAALSQRMPGRLGDWLHAVWRRLHPAENPVPVVLPIEHVLSIDSAVHVDEPAAQALGLTFGLELWLREHVIGRLPGANAAGGEQDRRRADQGETERGRPGEPPAPAREPPAPARAPLEDARGLSSVIGRPVLDAAGERTGRVREVRCSGRPRGEQQSPLRVERILYTPHLRVRARLQRRP